MANLVELEWVEFKKIFFILPTSDALVTLHIVTNSENQPTEHN